MTEPSAGAPPQPLLALLVQSAELAKQKRWAESLRVALQARALEPSHPGAAGLLGHACFALGRDLEAVDYFAQALAHDERQPALWHLRSVSLLRLGRAVEAYAHAERAAALAPGHAQYESQRRAAGAAAVPDWHFNMVNDAPRNAAFASAIARCVKPEQCVLEIGTGSGLLAMLAARARAQQVVSCEANAVLAHTATQIIAENGLSERVRVIAKPSTELEIGRDLAARADLLVCEIFSVQVLTEGVLPTIEDAKARLLVPGAPIIPAAAVARAALVQSAALARRVRAERVLGFDLSRLNAFTPLVQYVSAEQSLELLSAPFDVFRFDLAHSDAFPAEKRTLGVDVSADGVCQGVVQWLKLELAPGIEYENRPGSPEAEQSRHWHPVFYPFPAPLAVRAGQRVTLRASHNRSALRVSLAQGA